MKKPTSPILAFLAAGLVFAASAAQARTITVTEANAEKTVTLHQGDTLLVRLSSNRTTGYGWNVVYEPDGPLHLVSSAYLAPLPRKTGPPMVGVPGTEVFRFTVPRAASFGQGGWLRLLSLRPWVPGVKDAQMWEIKYTIAAAKRVAQKETPPIIKTGGVLLVRGG